jgi:hypothetical protein
MVRLLIALTCLGAFLALCLVISQHITINVQIVHGAKA